ncbi:uncharacterized protein BJ171DRAFT_508633 [Polychytrium aggregatum]|uniref:uncharacterized protein n=1 Tax=Polychytrium aggregatum TaxID=110093 RepID=UPI0022FED18E|nr:uncharacterized protein BJ171DRAFT_508633 [Polychytrium aggregatum]KAI9203903.1 hypothetical protein BJ171DRAFT_508633 [Polychytrium aggregatum]
MIRTGRRWPETSRPLLAGRFALSASPVPMLVPTSRLAHSSSTVIQIPQFADSLCRLFPFAADQHNPVEIVNRGKDYKILNPDRNVLHDCFRFNRPKNAWQTYSAMRLEEKLNLLSADDHTTLLGYLTRHSRPRLAAIQADRAFATLCQYHRPDIRDHNYVLMCHLRNQNDLPRLAGAFRKIYEHGNKPNSRSFALLMQSLVHDGQLEAAHSLWHEMWSELPCSEAQPDHWAIMIAGYAKAGNRKAVEDLQRQFARLRSDPASVVQDATIRAYGYLGDHAASEELFSSLAKSSSDPALQPRLESYDAIIHSALLNNKPEVAESHFAALIKRNATLSQAMFGHTLDEARTRALFDPFANLDEDSDDFVDDPEGVAPRGLWLAGIQPLSSTFYHLMEHYARKGDIDRVTELYTHLRLSKLWLHDCIFLVVATYIARNDPQNALRWYNAAVGPLRYHPPKALIAWASSVHPERIRS